MLESRDFRKDSFSHDGRRGILPPFALQLEDDENDLGRFCAGVE